MLCSKEEAGHYARAMTGNEKPFNTRWGGKSNDIDPLTSPHRSQLTAVVYYSRETWALISNYTFGMLGEFESTSFAVH